MNRFLCPKRSPWLWSRGHQMTWLPKKTMLRFLQAMPSMRPLLGLLTSWWGIRLEYHQYTASPTSWSSFSESLETLVWLPSSSDLREWEQWPTTSSWILHWLTFSCLHSVCLVLFSPTFSSVSFYDIHNIFHYFELTQYFHMSNMSFDSACLWTLSKDLRRKNIRW